MAPTDLSTATVSNLTDAIEDYTISTKDTDSPSTYGEYGYTWSNWTKYYGYYNQVPVVKRAIDVYALFAMGRGYQTSDSETETILDNITGNGKQTFNSILKNMIITMLINGDSFAEVIRNEKGQLVNIKPLNPGSITMYVGDNGIIKRYVQHAGKKGEITWQPRDIFHLCKDQVADSIHGTGSIESCEDIIKKLVQAMDDWNKVMHRNVYPMKIWHLDTDNQAEINAFITKVETTVKDKENIFIPKGNVEVEIPSVNPGNTLSGPTWIDMLKKQFWQVVGVPEIVASGGEAFSESSSKMAYLSFQQNVEDAQLTIESQIWEQLQLKINLVFMASMQNELISDTNKDAQEATNIQQSDTVAGAG